jgi:hypothetical protein
MHPFRVCHEWCDLGIVCKAFPYDRNTGGALCARFPVCVEFFIGGAFVATVWRYGSKVQAPEGIVLVCGTDFYVHGLKALRVNHVVRDVCTLWELLAHGWVEGVDVGEHVGVGAVAGPETGWEGLEHSGV